MFRYQRLQTKKSSNRYNLYFYCEVLIDLPSLIYASSKSCVHPRLSTFTTNWMYPGRSKRSFQKKHQDKKFLLAATFCEIIVHKKHRELSYC